MAVLGLVQRSSQGFLESEIRAFIAQYLKVDIASMDAHSHLTDDYGLDFCDVIKLLMALEERFGIDPETMDDPKQVEFVDDLISYIENSKWVTTPKL